MSAEEGTKPNKGFVRTAARWFSVLGVVAAAAALVLVPISIDPDAVISNPNVAYYTAQIRVFLVVSVTLLVAVMGMIVFDKRPLGAPVLVPALAFLGVSALSTLLSERTVHSLYGDRGQGLLSLVAGVLLFYALARGLTSSARLRLFLVAATTMAALVSVYGIAQNYGFEPMSGWGNPPFTDLGRSSATVGNPLTLAAYLTLMMGAATALWVGAATRARSPAWLVVLALIGACWIYAEARGALLGAGLALPLVLLAVHRRMGTVRPLLVPVAVLVAGMAVAVAASRTFGFSTLSIRACAVLLACLGLVGAFLWLLERGGAQLALLSLLVVLVGVGVAAFAAVFAGNLTLANLGLSRDGPGANQGIADLSTQIRLYIWRDSIPMILDRPLLGHGPDNYREPFIPYVSEELKAAIGDQKVDRVHNNLLQVAATTGLLGLGAYLWVLVSYFRNAYKSGGLALAALSGGVLAYVIQLQTVFSSVATDVAFWGVLGASVALMRLPDRGDEGLGGEADQLLPPRTPERGRPELLAGAADESRRSRRRSRRLVRGEPLVAIAVVGIIAIISLPVFVEQRERIAESERVELNAETLLDAFRYERFLRDSSTRPEAGVYTTTRPVADFNGRPVITPSTGVTLTIEPRPDGNFVMEWKKTTLAGTFVFSYESATRSYTTPSS